MIIVGSRTGAYQYWAQFDRRPFLWLGVRPGADLDVVNSPSAPGVDNRGLNEPPWLWHGLAMPVLQDGKLVRPPGFYYLLTKITKRLSGTEVCRLAGQSVNVLDTKFCLITRLVFWPMPPIGWIHRLSGDVLSGYRRFLAELPF